MKKDNLGLKKVLKIHFKKNGWDLNFHLLKFYFAEDMSIKEFKDTLKGWGYKTEATSNFLAVRLRKK